MNLVSKMVTIVEQIVLSAQYRDFVLWGMEGKKLQQFHSISNRSQTHKSFSKHSMSLKLLQFLAMAQKDYVVNLLCGRIPQTRRGPRREVKNPKLFAMMRRRSSFLEALMKDALSLINKMKHRLNTRHMRLVKEAIRNAMRTPEASGLICVCTIYMLEAFMI